MGKRLTIKSRVVLSMKSGVTGVAAINLLLAVLAFAKDLGMAACFGTSQAADALTLAFFVPDTIGNNLLASALGVACVPMFSKLLASGAFGAWRRLFRQILVAATALSALLLLVLYLGRDETIRLLADGFSPDALALCKELLLFLLPTLVLFPLSMIGSAGLQAVGKFAASAFGPVVFNAFYLAGVVLAVFLPIGQKQAAFVVTGGIVTGVVGMTLFVLLAISRKRDRSWWQPQSFHSKIPHSQLEQAEWKRVARLFALYLLLLLSTQTVYAVERHIASTLGSGTVAGLNYAFRMGQFANWVFIAALTTVLLPALSKAIEQRRFTEVRAQFLRAIRITLWLTVPIAALMFLLRVPLVTLLFEHGVFDQKSTQITADMLAGYALAIVPQALVAVCIRYFMAVERMRLPILAGLLAFAVNVCFDVRLAPHLGPSALGYGAAGAAWVNAAVLICCLAGDLHKWGDQGYAEKSLSHHSSGIS